MTKAEQRRVKEEHHKLETDLRLSQSKLGTATANIERLNLENDRLGKEVEKLSRVTPAAKGIAGAVILLVAGAVLGAPAGFFLTPDIAAALPGPKVSASLWGVKNSGNGCIMYELIASSNGVPVDKLDLTIAVPGVIREAYVLGPERERSLTSSAVVEQVDATGDCKLSPAVGYRDAAIHVQQVGQSKFTVSVTDQHPSLFVSGSIAISRLRTTRNPGYTIPVVEGTFTYTNRGVQVTKNVDVTVTPVAKPPT